MAEQIMVGGGAAGPSSVISGGGSVSGTSNIGGASVRKTSPEALAIMMQNLKQHKQKTGPLSNVSNGNLSGNESSGSKPWAPLSKIPEAVSTTNRIKKIIAT